MIFESVLKRRLHCFDYSNYKTLPHTFTLYLCFIGNDIEESINIQYGLERCTRHPWATELPGCLNGTRGQSCRFRDRPK